MEKISPIKERIFQFIESQGIKKSDFFNKTGISYANFKGKSLQSELGGDKLAEITTIYSEISTEWLLTGRGSMLLDRIPEAKNITVISDMGDNVGRKIPLVSQSAVAGFGNSNFAIAEQDVKEYYVIPKFKYCRIDFMIEVSGSSMYPKYNSGDVVACTIIRDSNFIQWNKCHVIATKEQGILVKRLKKGEDINHLLAISDNKDYDPFQIPVSEITGIALVVGVIRLE